MRVLLSLFCGLLFGLGLVVSGMSNPAKVMNFLDFAGTWDASLLFVMAGAMLTTSVGYRLVSGRAKPILGDHFHWPTRRELDAPLVLGAGLFGLGWGLSGFCPGPAATAIAGLDRGTLVFVPALLFGMALARRWQRRDATGKRLSTAAWAATQEG